MNEDNKYSYTYSAEDREEIKKIREKYCPAEENKIAKLRRLDAGVTKKGTFVSLIIGIMGCLVLGTGISFVTVWSEELFLPGVVIGVVGLIGITAAYPLYTYITAKEREKLAPEILRLTEELLQ